MRRMDHAIAILLASALTVNGLTAYRAATMRGHWFLRTALAAIGPVFALAASASEIFLTLAGQAGIIAAGVAYFARRRGQHREDYAIAWRFSLATFLLATLLASVGAAVVAKFPAGNRLLFQSMPLVSVCSGLMILVGAWGASRLVWRDAVGVVGAVLLGGFLLGLPLAWFDWFALSFLDPTLGWPPEVDPNASIIHMIIGEQVERPVMAWLKAGPAVALATTLLLKVGGFAGLLAGRDCVAATGSTGLRIFAKAAFFTGVVAAALPTAWVWQRMMFPDAIPEIVLPQPNGREDFVAAGRRLKLDVTFDPNVMFEELIDTRSELEATIRDSRPALELMRQGLLKESMSPPNYTSDDLSEEIDFMMEITGIRRALAATGELAVLEGRVDDATHDYLDLIKLGMATRRGGMLVDMLFSMAIAHDGIDGLRKLRGQMTPQQRTAAIEKLTALYAAMEPQGEHELRDRIWSQHAHGWHGRVDLALSDFADEYGIFDPEAFDANCLRERTQLALLILELAILSHVEEYGATPAKLSDLAISHRELVVADPYRDRQGFVYARRGDGYLLYSVGVDGVDDGGKPPVFGEFETFNLETKGDLTLDSSFPAEE